MGDVFEPRAMGIGKVFKDNEARVTSMDFSDDGELLVTSSEDETLHVYGVQGATMQRVLYTKKYGADLVRFTHQNDSVIHASRNGWDETIRYLSLHDNTYIRYFRGHRDRVVSLSFAPTSDLFVSAALDATVRSWDVRVSGCLGVLRLPTYARPSCAYDPSGRVLAVAAGADLKLYDARKYDSGPFGATRLDLGSDVCSAQMSADGRYLLISTVENAVAIVDAFLPPDRPALLRTFTSFTNDAGLVLQPSFSQDSRFVLSGSEDGTVHVWSTETGEEVSVWSGHAGAVGIVRCNPKFNVVASSCTNVAFWIPQPPATPAATQPQQPMS